MGEKEIAPTEDLLRSFFETMLENFHESKVPDRFMRIEEAQTYLGQMPKQTLQQKVYNKEITAYKVGKSLIFDRKELREWVKRNKV